MARRDDQAVMMFWVKQTSGKLRTQKAFCYFKVCEITLFEKANVTKNKFNFKNLQLDITIS